MYAFVALSLLVVYGWNYIRALHATRVGHQTILNLQIPIEILPVVAWVLLCGILVHSEALPGTRPYWLVRPLRWQDLACAKSLLLTLLVAVPLWFVQMAFVASSGFSPWENAGAVFWNSILTGLVCLLPVAVLTSISRNIGELIFWILGIATGVIVIHQFVTGFPDGLRWVTNAVTIVTGVFGGIAILVWQYATRRTRAGHVAVISLSLLLASFEFWPHRLWYAIQRAASPAVVSEQTAQLHADMAQMVWHPQSFTGARPRLKPSFEIPLRIEGLQEGWTVALNGWSAIRVQAGTERLQQVDIYSPPLWLGNRDSQKTILELNPDFARSHQHDAIDIDLTFELTIYTAPKYQPIPINGDSFVPELGRCRSDASDALFIDCHFVLGAGSHVRGFWAKGIPAKGSPQVLTLDEDRSPVLLTPTLHPISFLIGGFSARSSYEGKDIVIESQRPIAHVQRKVELRGIQITKYAR